MKRAHLLAAGGADLKIARNDLDVTINVPEAAPDKNDSVIVLE
jgi:hypothetical protein